MKNQDKPMHNLHIFKHFYPIVKPIDYFQRIESIIDKIISKEIDVYLLLDNFVSYPRKLSPATITLYVSAVKSYLQYYDVDI